MSMQLLQGQPAPRLHRQSVSDATPLATLAIAIKREHSEYLTTHRRSLEHAIMAGKLLLDAKNQPGRGPGSHGSKST